MHNRTDSNVRTMEFPNLLVFGPAASWEDLCEASMSVKLVGKRSWGIDFVMISGPRGVLSGCLHLSPTKKKERSPKSARLYLSSLGSRVGEEAEKSGKESRWFERVEMVWDLSDMFGRRVREESTTRQLAWTFRTSSQNELPKLSDVEETLLTCPRGSLSLSTSLSERQVSHRCVPHCVAEPCAVHPVGSRSKQNVPRGHEANANSKTPSQAPRQCWTPGHQQHPEPGNQDRQQKLSQPRGSFP